MTKTLNILKTKNLFNQIKSIHEKPTANITLHGERLNAFSLRSGAKYECPLFATSILHSTGDFSQGNQARKRHKGHPIGKEEVELHIFTGNMILYAENPKESTKTLLGLINKFNKAAG